MIEEIKLPKKPKGRPPKEWYKKLQKFSKQLQEIQKHMAHKVSSRGWCYVLEGDGLISKGQFDYVQGLINKARKKNDRKYLPIDFVLQDEDREFKPKEMVDRFDMKPKEYLEYKIEDFLGMHERYDIGFWQYHDVYIQTVVEKIDLYKAWKSISYKYHIPIANTSGWYSILMRAKMIERFKKAEEYGKQPILLIFTDFDPYGRDMIAKKMRRNLNDLSEATRWRADNLIIDRFGLSEEQVEEHNLTWIENLETGSGKNLASPRHPDYNKEFIQKWLDEVGERKVEANALLKNPEIMEKIYEKAIKSHLSKNPLEEYEKEVEERKEKIKKLIKEKGIEEALNQAL